MDTRGRVTLVFLCSFGTGAFGKIHLFKILKIIFFCIQKLKLTEIKQCILSTHKSGIVEREVL